MLSIVTYNQLANWAGVEQANPAHVLYSPTPNATNPQRQEILTGLLDPTWLPPEPDHTPYVPYVPTLCCVQQPTTPPHAHVVPEPGTGALFAGTLALVLLLRLVAEHGKQIVRIDHVQRTIPRPRDQQREDAL